MIGAEIHFGSNEVIRNSVVDENEWKANTVPDDADASLLPNVNDEF
jgi:hypothetical protein